MTRRTLLTDEDRAAAYERRKAQSAAGELVKSAAGRDIGEIPAVADPERKARCARAFRLYCETYRAATFAKPWSSDHLVVLGKIERTVLAGGQFANAMPRGDGKTSLVEAASEWALLYGHRRFIMAVGADRDAALSMLDSIRLEFESNDLLLADFPEVCYPIRRLEGLAQRAKGQLCQGERTRIRWTTEELMLPTIRGSAASGAIIRVAGITGRIRGAKSKTADGETIRPDLVLIDDPQTEESARSPSQVEARERVVQQAVLGLGGPGVRIAALAAVTVVQEDDLADRWLDRKRNPEWQGERSRMLHRFPDRLDLWEQYDEIRRECYEEDDPEYARATEFYREHREAMDEGARVSWPERHYPHELSAVQHAMTLWLTDEQMFWAEYQNEPSAVRAASGIDLTADGVCERTNGLERWSIPEWAVHLTASIDVQMGVLYWMVTAWALDATGAVIAYGSSPDQRRPYWTLAEAQRTYQGTRPGVTWEDALAAELGATCDRILGREYVRSDGRVMHVERATVDAGWGDSTEVVYGYCRTCGYRGILFPAHGRGIGAAARPMEEHKRERGEVRGPGWRRLPAKKHGHPYVLHDVNRWKGWARQRMLTPQDAPGALTLYGDKPGRHRMLADHLTAEAPVTEVKGTRRVDVWKLRRRGRDNHWWDTLVGCCVAASMLGVEASSVAAEAGRRGAADRKRVSFAQMQQARRSRR